MPKTNAEECTEAHIEEMRAQLKVCIEEITEVNEDEKTEIWEVFESLENLLLDVTTEVEYRKEQRSTMYRAGYRGSALHDNGDY